MNFVYLIINLVNGKQYIGSHNGDENDSYLGSGLILEFAKSKYGKESFKRKILEITKTRKEAFDLEKPYIKKYNTLIPNGYNILPSGGANLPGWKQTKEAKEKISKANKGKIRSEKTKKQISESKEGMMGYFLGKKLTGNHKEKIINGLKKYKKKNKFKNLNENELKIKRVGKYNPFYGNTHKTEKNYIKKYTTRKGITPSNAIKVKNIETGEIFDSCSAAAKKFNNSNTARRFISDVCKGKRKDYKGERFEYF